MEGYFWLFADTSSLIALLLGIFFIRKNFWELLAGVWVSFVPETDSTKGIIITPGFNAIVGEDENGRPRAASSFEEWLEHVSKPLGNDEKDNHFTNRLAFHIYKRREREYAAMVEKARKKRSPQLFIDSSSSE